MYEVVRNINVLVLRENYQSVFWKGVVRNVTRLDITACRFF